MFNIFKNKNKNENVVDSGLIEKDGKHYRKWLGRVSNISEEEIAEMESNYNVLVNESFDKFQAWVNNNDPTLIERFICFTGLEYSNYVDIIKYNHLTMPISLCDKILRMANELESESDIVYVYRDFCVSRMIKMDDKFSYLYTKV